VKAGEMSMEVYTFPEDDQPSVLTADLCEHFGGCSECPGFTTAGELAVPDHDPDEAVFCTHWCHRSTGAVS
jgi:hypothetical protein